MRSNPETKVVTKVLGHEAVFRCSVFSVFLFICLVLLMARNKTIHNFDRNQIADEFRVLPARIKRSPGKNPGPFHQYVMPDVSEAIALRRVGQDHLGNYVDHTVVAVDVDRFQVGITSKGVGNDQ